MPSSSLSPCVRQASRPVGGAGVTCPCDLRLALAADYMLRPRGIIFTVQRRGTLMKAIFDAQTRRLLAFLADLRYLSPAEIDQVTNAWKHVSGLDPAEAWAQLHRVTTQNERYPIP